MKMINDITFLNPEFLWFFIMLLIVIGFDFSFKKLKNSNFKVSSLKFLNQPSFKSKVYPFMIILRYLAITFLIIALARPQILDVSVQTKKRRPRRRCRGRISARSQAGCRGRHRQPSDVVGALPQC